MRQTSPYHQTEERIKKVKFDKDRSVLVDELNISGTSSQIFQKQMQGKFEYKKPQKQQTAGAGGAVPKV